MLFQRTPLYHASTTSGPAPTTGERPHGRHRAERADARDRRADRDQLFDFLMTGVAALAAVVAHAMGDHSDGLWLILALLRNRVLGQRRRE